MRIFLIIVILVIVALLFYFYVPIINTPNLSDSPESTAEYNKANGIPEQKPAKISLREYFRIKRMIPYI